MIRRLRAPTALTILALIPLAALPAGTLAQDPLPQPLPATGEDVAAGDYFSEAIGPTIELRLGEGWRVGPGGEGPIVTLERTDVPGSVLSITRFDGDTFVDSCDTTSLTTTEATVERLVEIIAGNPFLAAAPARPTTVDGHEGLLLDVATPPVQECAVGFLLLFAVPDVDGGEFVQVPGQQSRFILLDVAGDVVVIAIETFPGVPFGSLLDVSTELVASMRITPIGVAPRGDDAGPTDGSPSPEANGSTPAPAATTATASPGAEPDATAVPDRTPTPMATEPPGEG